MFPRFIMKSKQVVGGRTIPSWGNLFIDHMKSIDTHFDPGHRIDHVMRVTNTALMLAERERARLEIVLPAVILHDSLPMDKFAKNSKDASALSAENTIKLLKKWNYPSELLLPIRHAILTHSFSANITPETLEAKVVQDADRLDALGAIGIARTMAVGFKHGNPLYNFDEPFPGNRKADDKTNILDHFYLKLFRLPETLHTETAKEMAKIRIRLMGKFLKGLADEIGVEYISYDNYIKKQNINSEENNMQRKDLICAGTFGLTNAEEMIQAIKAGYRYFDTATAYKNVHQALAVAMQDFNRDEFHICTKINDGDLIKHDFSVSKILDDILKELNTNYVDTLMLHSPALLLHEHGAAVFNELIELKQLGLIKHIGLSNFTVQDLKRLDNEYLKHIDYNQIELSPYCQQNDIVTFCKEHNIQIMAYRPFGNGKADDLLQNETLIAIARKHDITVHQVILAWIMQQKMIAISKAGKIDHLESNLKACNVTLDPEEMQAISKLDRNLNTCGWEKFVKLNNFKTYMNFPLLKTATNTVRFSVFPPVDANKETSALAALPGLKSPGK